MPQYTTMLNCGPGFLVIEMFGNNEGLRGIGKKGFFLSVSIFMIVMFALLFSQQFLHKSQGFENSFSERFALQKAAFVSDNVSSQAAALLGAKVGFEDSPASSIVRVSSGIPCGASASGLSGFKSFVENEVSQLNNSQLSIDFSRLSEGKQELLFSNGLQMDCNNSSGNSLEFYSTNDSSMPLVFDLNIEGTGSLNDVAAWQWQPSGDLEVRIHYKDSTITYIGSGKIDASIENSFRFNYSGGSLKITAGSFNGHSKALKIEIDNDANVSAAIVSRISLPQQEKPVASYDASTSFKQAGVEKTSSIEPLQD